MDEHSIDPLNLEGGFITIRKNLWRGTVRYRRSKQIVWTCKHNHSRPEYNARHQANHDEVWEYSALNCGRDAHRQWIKDPSNVKGLIGLVGDWTYPVELRDDTRYAAVQETTYLGRVRLTDNGQRELKVSHEKTNISGTVNLDVTSNKGVTLPDVDLHELAKWVTATWMLKGAIWGVIFQDPRVSMYADKVSQRALEEFVGHETKPAGKRKLKVPGTPHINVAHQGKRRLYEIVDQKGEVVETFLHRGQAQQALTDLKEKG